MPPSSSDDGPRLNDSACSDALDLLGSEAPAGRPYRLYRSRAGARWLIPDGPAGRAASTGLYAPQKAAGHALLLAMRVGLPVGEVRRLDPARIDDLARHVERVTGTGGLTLAFSLGPPRPEVRLTAAAVDARGRVAAFVKVAGNEPARAGLRRETVTLRRLARGPLAGRVPAVLGEFAWWGARALVVAPGPARHGPTRPGDAHVDFLEAVAEHTMVEGPYAGSASARRLAAALEEGDTSPAWRSRLAAVAERLASRLGGAVLPMRLVHHDFVPWNTRLGAGGLWVFDWESAEDVDLPLLDETHLCFAPAALSGRAEPRRFLERVLERQAAVVRRHRAELRLAYLAIASLRYGAGRTGDEGAESPVVRRARREMDERLGTVE